MGLSDPERTDYIFHAIKEIVSLADELKDDRYFSKVKKEVDKLWSATLGNISNGAHWILGSSATNQIKMDDLSVFSVALRNCFKDDVDNAKNEEKREKDPEYKSMKEIMDDHFDPMDMLTIAHLIRDSDDYESKEHVIVYEIFAWTEQLAYGLRRYDDEFFKNFKELSDVIANIQGACFPIFKSEIYRKAYLLNQIFQILYSSHYDRKGNVRKILVDNNMHHNLTRGCMREVQMGQILKWHERLVIDSSDEECIFVAFEIAGRRLHHKYDYEKYVKELREAKTKIDFKKLESIFKNNCLAHKENEEEHSREYEKNADSNHFYCVHGKFLDNEH